jgi:chromosome condensin MukBEF complex kleisin-like MukF subunit
MSTTKGYNGHKNWNHWNVSLWIGNDEGLYRLARECIRMTNNRTEAVDRFMDALGDVEKTPDGARYNKTTVRAAMRDL